MNTRSKCAASVALAAIGSMVGAATPEQGHPLVSGRSGAAIVDVAPTAFSKSDLSGAPIGGRTDVTHDQVLRIDADLSRHSSFSEKRTPTNMTHHSGRGIQYARHDSCNLLGTQNVCDMNRCGHFLH